MGPITKDSFKPEDFKPCFIKTSDGREIPFSIESIDFSPFLIGPEITGHIVGFPENGKVSDPIEKVIFNDPATIVIWKDKTKTVVKCQEGDIYSPELGLAMCIAKKYLGNKGNFNEVFKKWIPVTVREISTFNIEHIRDGIVEFNQKLDSIIGKKEESPEREISIEEMRSQLQSFCNKKWMCNNCPLDTPENTCGRGCSFDDPEERVSDEEVVKSYEKIFGNKED